MFYQQAPRPQAVVDSDFRHSAPEQGDAPEQGAPEQGDDGPADDPFASVDMNTPLYVNAVDGIDGVVLGEILLIMFDWVAAHKTTGRCTKDVWSVLKAVCPPGTPVGTYAMAQTIVRHHLNGAVELVPVCRNDCCAFFNFKSENLCGMQYADLDACPRCGTDRYVTCGVSGARKNAKVMYYLPTRLYWEFLFSLPEVSSQMYNDVSCGRDAPGGIRSSGGYYNKVTANSNISSDPRNQAYCLSTDGMPFFKDVKSRSGWPILLRSAMLPAGLWNTPAYTHMVAFQPAEEWVRDETDGGKLVRHKGSCTNTANGNETHCQ